MDGACPGVSRAALTRARGFAPSEGWWKSVALRGWLSPPWACAQPCCRHQRIQVGESCREPCLCQVWIWATSFHLVLPGAVGDERGHWSATGGEVGRSFGLKELHSQGRMLPTGRACV